MIFVAPLLVLLSLDLANVGDTGSADVSRATPNVAACDADFDGDGRVDTALLISRPSAAEALVLMGTERGYAAVLVVRGVSGARLSCRKGTELVETRAGKDPKRPSVHRTPGAFLELKQPEGASAAYFWNGSGFTEVWIED